MNASNERLMEGEVQNSENKKDNLVLSIDKNGKITKFNDLCESISGYSKNDVFKKSFFELLVPVRYKPLWDTFFVHSQQNKAIHDFKIPFLTKHGHEIMISWSSFPVKEMNSDTYKIDLVGSMVSTWKDIETPKIEIPLDFSNNTKKSKSIFPIKISKSNKEDKLVKKLKKLNEELENKNKILEKQIKNFKSKEDHYKEALEKSIKQSNIIVNKGLYSFSELYGGKKRKEEFEIKLKEIDEREKRLNKAEIKLIEDKKTINKHIQEFREWREKLETLESDIEKRRMDLMNQEKILISDITGSDKVDVNETTKEDLKETYDVFEKIQDSAAIIQRGIFKRVNDSFTNLIGYNTDDIINKSLFDFVSPEGFMGMEKYYLNRLKGENISNYETVILSKNNDKIEVEINSRPTFHNGEKAEIAVFKPSREKIIDEAKIDKKSPYLLNSDKEIRIKSEIDDSQKKETFKEKQDDDEDIQVEKKEILPLDDEYEVETNGSNELIDDKKELEEEDSNTLAATQKDEGENIYKSEYLNEKPESSDIVGKDDGDISLSNGNNVDIYQKDKLEKPIEPQKEELKDEITDKETKETEISNKENEIEPKEEDPEKMALLRKRFTSTENTKEAENDNSKSDEEEINKNRFNKSKEIKEE